MKAGSRPTPGSLLSSNLQIHAVRTKSLWVNIAPRLVDTLIKTGGQEPYGIGRRPAFTGKPVLEGAVRDMVQPGNC